ncbi:MAG: hypothetical protein V4458_01150 [Pseudomonadota bacterium]|nr:hypothetical protein [Afipia sp.]
MFRKLTLAVAATAALGAAALAPTAASAGGGHGHHGGHGWGHGGGHGIGFGFSPVIVSGGYADDTGCYVQRRVRTPHGIRWRTVNVCY